MVFSAKPPHTRSGAVRELRPLHFTYGKPVGRCEAPRLRPVVDFCVVAGRDFVVYRNKQRVRIRRSIKHRTR